MDGFGTWEIALDVYRDLILTGVFISIITAVYRLGGWNADVKQGFASLTLQMKLHYQENKESHEKLHTLVKDIDTKVDGYGERITRVETHQLVARGK